MGTALLTLLLHWGRGEGWQIAETDGNEALVLSYIRIMISVFYLAVSSAARWNMTFPKPIKHQSFRCVRIRLFGNNSWKESWKTNQKWLFVWWIKKKKSSWCCWLAYYTFIIVVWGDQCFKSTFQIWRSGVSDMSVFLRFSEEKSASAPIIRWREQKCCFLRHLDWRLNCFTIVDVIVTILVDFLSFPFLSYLILFFAPSFFLFCPFVPVILSFSQLVSVCWFHIDSPFFSFILP